jgi:hypothetical protein
LVAWDLGAKGAVADLSRALQGGPQVLYRFPTDISPRLPRGEVNLLSDPSFENTRIKLCTFECNAGSGWSIEQFSVGSPNASRTRHGVVTGNFAERIVYIGQKGDNGLHKDVELYHGAAGPRTTAGHKLTFTLWVSGSCVRCAPFIGIEAFDIKNHYLGESDQYFRAPKKPKPVRVSYLLPVGTVVVAAYIQVPELYSFSKVDLIVDDASLVAAPHRFHPPRPTYN